MLTSIRNRTKGTFAYVIVAFIAVPFLLVGIGDYLAPTDDRGIYVGDVKISQAMIDSITKNKVQEFKERTKLSSLDIEGEIREYVEADLIQNEILTRFQKENNVQATQTNIATEINTQEIFHSDEKFSMDRYRAILKMNNMTIAQYEQRVFGALANTNVEQLMFAPLGGVNNKLIDAIMGESKDVLVKNIQYDVIRNPITPTKQELATHFQENKASYLTQKTANIDYFEITDDSIRETIIITTDQIDNAYKTYASNIDIATTYTFIQDQHETEEKAVESMGEFSNMGPGDEFFKKESMTAQSGDLGEEMEGILFKMVPMEPKVFKSSFGWHSAMMISINKTDLKSRGDMDQDLRKSLQDEQLSLAKNILIEDINSTIYEDGMENTSLNNNTTLQSINGVTKNDLIWSSKSNEEIWQKANSGNTGLMEEDGKSIFYRFRSIALPRQMTMGEANGAVQKHVIANIISERKIAKVDIELSKNDKSDWTKLEINRDLKQNNKLSRLVFSSASNGDAVSGWIENGGQIYAYTTTGEIKFNNAWDSNTFTAIVKGEKQQWFNQIKGDEYGIERKE